MWFQRRRAKERKEAEDAKLQQLLAERRAAEAEGTGDATHGSNTPAAATPTAAAAITAAAGDAATATAPLSNDLVISNTGAYGQWAEYAELLNKAKETLPQPYREDGPRLGFEFDPIPTAGDGDANKRKRLMLDGFEAELEDDGEMQIRKRRLGDASMVARLLRGAELDAETQRMLSMQQHTESALAKVVCRGCMVGIGEVVVCVVMYWRASVCAGGVVEWCWSGIYIHTAHLYTQEQAQLNDRFMKERERVWYCCVLRMVAVDHTLCVENQPTCNQPTWNTTHLHTPPTPPHPTPPQELERLAKEQLRMAEKAERDTTKELMRLARENERKRQLDERENARLEAKLARLQQLEDKKREKEEKKKYAVVRDNAGWVCRCVCCVPAHSVQTNIHMLTQLP